MLEKNTIWRCIDESDEFCYGKLCVIKYVDTHPDFNGEGTIELLYSDNSAHYGKTRRFVPNLTHKFVKYSRMSYKQNK